MPRHHLFRTALQRSATPGTGEAMDREYVVWVQKTESHDWFELCRCETVTTALHVCRAILEGIKTPPRYVRVEVVEVD